MADIERPWLKQYDDEVLPRLDYDLRPVFEFLDRAAEKWPNRKAVVFQNWTCTYKKLQKLSGIFAANLRSQGIRPGDRVAIMLPNTPQALIAYWGILRAGAVVVMTNPLYMETEIVHQFKDAGVKMVVMLDLLWPRMEKLLDQIPPSKFFVTSIADGLKFPLNWLYRLKSWKEGKRSVVPYDGNKVQKFTTLLTGSDTFTHEGINAREDTALLQYTGGTTGVAKGCIITHANLVSNMQQAAAVVHTLRKGEETFIGVLPFFHIYGLTTCVNLPTLVGATLAPFPRYVPQDLLKAINKMRPTVFPGAPAVYVSLLQQKDLASYDLTSIRYLISGSAPIPVEHIEKFKEVTGAQIVEGFGLTEASPVTHLNPLGGVTKNGSIGLPFPDTDAKIVDMDVGGESLPPGKLGELVIRGPQVMKGYFKREDATADVLRNGWLYTGDIAYMDEEGYFFIVDRKKDLIISAGYNIYPREIDEVLYAHPKITEAVSVGIPHPSRGEIVKAYVVVKKGETLDRSEVIAYCREKLANYKVPRKVEFRDELPKTMVGKVLRRALRDEEEAKLAKRKK